MPQLWLPFEQLRDQLESWADAYASRLALEELGRSAEGRGIYAVTLTDPDAEDEDKEHVLITAQHSGIERSGSGSVFALIEWLLSPDPLAKEVLRRQVVVCMPLVNPDGYVHGTHATTHGRDPYTYWTLDGPCEPQRMPESVAVQEMMDRLQPEVHADVHGLDESFDGYMSLENSGFSYSNNSLRPYHYDLARTMDDAALAGGYPSDRLEQDGERVLWGPELEGMAEKTWLGRPRVYAATYCYARYHSLTLASECMWEHSGLLRHQALLRTGNETWPGEYYPGYATRVVASNILHQVVAYGCRAACRRASRVELWDRQGQICHGPVNPQIDGLAVLVCATSREARERWLGDGSLAAFRRGLEAHPGIDAAQLLALLDRHPSGPGQWGAEPSLYLTGGESDASAPIERGLGLRLRIPYSRARVRGVLLNGRALGRSDRNGYTLWNARGFTVVQVNVPPEVSREDTLFVVAVDYDPREKRLQGWRPAEE